MRPADFLLFCRAVNRRRLAVRTHFGNASPALLAGRIEAPGATGAFRPGLEPNPSHSQVKA